MKTKSQKSCRWNENETSRLRLYIESEEKNLLTNFYKNIFMGQLNFRRPAKFFQKMSVAVGRNSKQCKSKMQKFEEEAFVGILKVPKEHYKFYQVLRKLKSMSKKTQNVGQMFKKRNKFAEKREKIIQEISDEKVIFKSINCYIDKMLFSNVILYKCYFVIQFIIFKK
jgi:hypothetical protein